MTQLEESFNMSLDTSRGSFSHSSGSRSREVAGETDSALQPEKFGGKMMRNA